MRDWEQAEKELEHEKKRLSDAAEQLVNWFETLPPGRLAKEKPWALAGIAAVIGVGVGYVAHQWLSSYAGSKD